jgi:hypothetical protein
VEIDHGRDNSFANGKEEDQPLRPTIDPLIYKGATQPQKRSPNLSRKQKAGPFRPADRLWELLLP